MNREKLKEYLKEICCRFLGLHNWGYWYNGSRFVDNGGWSFGWVARKARKCLWCHREQKRAVFLESERKRLIHENSENGNKYGFAPDNYFNNPHE